MYFLQTFLENIYIVIAVEAFDPLPKAHIQVQNLGFIEAI